VPLHQVLRYQLLSTRISANVQTVALVCSFSCVFKLSSMTQGSGFTLQFTSSLGWCNGYNYHWLSRLTNIYNCNPCMTSDSAHSHNMLNCQARHTQQSVAEPTYSLCHPGAQSTCLPPTTRPHIRSLPPSHTKPQHQNSGSHETHSKSSWTD
jgi:hypothetical protein